MAVAGEVLSFSSVLIIDRGLGFLRSLRWGLYLEFPGRDNYHIHSSANDDLVGPASYNSART